MSTDQTAASDLLKALALRHSDALFIGGCKSGPTDQPRDRLRILDAWVLLRTWSPITAIGYEVKVSRADWLQDEKYHQYLPLCHQLYLVAPKGLIQAQELPPQVGLLEALHGGRLVTRVKASRREITLPEDLLVYVLMARVKPKQDNDREDRIAHWAHWLATRREGERIGHLVSQAIKDQVNQLRRDLQQVEHRTACYESAKRTLAEAGLNIDRPYELKDRVTGQPDVHSELAAIERTVATLCRRLGYPARPPATLEETS